MARRRSNRKSNIIDLSTTVEQILQEYGDDVAAVIPPAVEEVAQDTVQELKSTGDYEDRTGDYRKSFDYRVDKTYRRTTATVFSNDPDYRLTHLLEKGHMTRDGTSRVRAYPHWKLAEEKANREFERKVRDGVENI